MSISDEVVKEGEFNLVHVSRTGELLRVQYARPGTPPVAIGVMLLDAASDTLLMRFTSDWSQYEPDEVLILSALQEDLIEKARSLGGTNLVHYLSETLSNTILISGPEIIHSADMEQTLHDRFAQEVAVALLPAISASPVLQNQARLRLIQSRGRVATALATAAGILLVLFVSRGTGHIEAVTPQVWLSQSRQVSVATVNSLTDTPIRVPLIAPRRTARRVKGVNYNWHPRRQFAILTEGYAGALDVESSRPILLDPLDVEIATSVDLLNPQVGELSLPEPQERRGRRVLQAITLPFRKFGRMLTN